MKKTLISSALAIFLSVLLFIVGYFILHRQGIGALQITTSVKATVFLDDKLIGTTPLYKESITTGTHQLKLVPQDTSLSSFTQKIKVNDQTLTAVDRTFLPGGFSSSYTLLPEKDNNNETKLLITSLPNQALVSIDGNPSGVTPYLIDKITATDHDIEINKPGYNKKTLRVHTPEGYKLIVDIILGTEEKIESPKLATPSAILTPTPTASESATVTILSTPTGFLRVRSEASISSSEVGRVKPGEEYPLLDETTGWYKIKLPETEGWISSSYAKTSKP